MTFTIETIFAYEDVRVEGVFVCLLREFIDGRCIDSYVDGWRKRYVVESFESIFACATSYEDKNDSDTLFIRSDDEIERREKEFYKTRKNDSKFHFFFKFIEQNSLFACATSYKDVFKCKK